MYENKYILQKSRYDKENYDILVFACRNIENATIPSFIEIIDSYAFEIC